MAHFQLMAHFQWIAHQGSGLYIDNTVAHPSASQTRLRAIAFGFFTRTPTGCPGIEPFIASTDICRHPLSAPPGTYRG